jgi:hypothetical protein
MSCAMHPALLVFCQLPTVMSSRRTATPPSHSRTHQRLQTSWMGCAAVAVAVHSDGMGKEQQVASDWRINVNTYSLLSSRPRALVSSLSATVHSLLARSREARVRPV